MNHLHVNLLLEILLPNCGKNSRFLFSKRSSFPLNSRKRSTQAVSVSSAGALLLPLSNPKTQFIVLNLRCIPPYPRHSPLHSVCNGECHGALCVIFGGSSFALRRDKHLHLFIHKSLTLTVQHNVYAGLDHRTQPNSLYLLLYASRPAGLFRKKPALAPTTWNYYLRCIFKIGTFSLTLDNSRIWSQTTSPSCAIVFTYYLSPFILTLYVFVSRHIIACGKWYSKLK